MDQGVDAIIQHTDSPAAMTAAEERGRYAVGQAADMSRFGPKAQLLSIVNDWGGHYIKTVQAVMDGTWKPRDYWGGMKDDLIVIAGFNKSIPGEIVADAKKIIGGIKDGSFHPFTDPTKDQSGKVRVAAGTRMTYAELAAMNWYVQGIQGKLPK